jgi:hypothetical protein
LHEVQNDILIIRDYLPTPIGVFRLKLLLQNNWGQSKINVERNSHKKCDSDPNYSGDYVESLIEAEYYE